MVISEGSKCGYFFPIWYFQTQYSISSFNFHGTFCTDFSTIQPDFLEEQQQLLYLWLHSSNFPWVTGLPPRFFTFLLCSGWHVKLEIIAINTHIHTHIHIRILNKFNFLLSLLPFRFMTHVGMWVDLNDSLPFPVFCLSHGLAPQLRQECFLMTMLHLKDVQVSSGAISSFPSNIYADLALMTPSIYCSVWELPSFCMTLWALGGSVFLEIQNCSPQLLPLFWLSAENSLLWITWVETLKAKT